MEKKTVRLELAEFFDNLYSCKKTLSKTIEDYDKLYIKAESEIKQIIIDEFVNKLKGELVYNNHMPEVIDEEKIDRIYQEAIK